MSVSRAERFQWAGIVVVLAMGVAAAIWAQLRAVAGDLPIDYGAAVDLDDWLPENALRDGPNVVAFKGPPTEEGVREAVRWQIQTAQALRSVEGHDLWSLATCSHWYLDPYHSLGEVELARVDVVEFSPETARVRPIYRSPDHPGADVAAAFGRSERWTYADGAWTNQTCSYGLGPEIDLSFRLIALDDDQRDHIVDLLDAFAGE